MAGKQKQLVERAKAAALAVLLRNRHGPCQGLPRTAGRGYPEPYTRDLLISLPGVLVCGNDELIETWRRVLQTLAANQTALGHIPSLVHPARSANVEFGFNEWFRAQDGTPRGEDWQTWSAAAYLCAARCVETRTTPFFGQVRRRSHRA